MVVTNHTTGEKAVVQFQGYKSQGQKFKQLQGSVKDASGEARIILEGNWMEGMQCYRVGKVVSPVWYAYMCSVQSYLVRL